MSRKVVDIVIVGSDLTTAALQHKLALLTDCHSILVLDELSHLAEETAPGAYTTHDANVAFDWGDLNYHYSEQDALRAHDASQALLELATSFPQSDEKLVTRNRLLIARNRQEQGMLKKLLARSESIGLEVSAYSKAELAALEPSLNLESGERESGLPYAIGTQDKPSSVNLRWLIQSLQAESEQTAAQFGIKLNRLCGEAAQLTDLRERSGVWYLTTPTTVIECKGVIFADATRHLSLAHQQGVAKDYLELKLNTLRCFSPHLVDSQINTLSSRTPFEKNIYSRSCFVDITFPAFRSMLKNLGRFFHSSSSLAFLLVSLILQTPHAGGRLIAYRLRRIFKRFTYSGYDRWTTLNKNEARILDGFTGTWLRTPMTIKAKPGLWFHLPSRPYSSWGVHTASELFQGVSEQLELTRDEVALRFEKSNAG